MVMSKYERLGNMTNDDIAIIDYNTSKLEGETWMLLTIMIWLKNRYSLTILNKNNL